MNFIDIYYLEKYILIHFFIIIIIIFTKLKYFLKSLKQT